MAGLASIPGGARLRETQAWKKLRHRISLVLDERQNSQFTGFLRLATQFRLLSGPVVEMLAQHAEHAPPFRIGVLGCSNGAEAYAIASVLIRHHPQLAFRVQGYDVDGASVEKARHARYEAGEIFNNKVITDDFVQQTFDRDGDAYVVKPHIAARVRFEIGDALSHDLPVKVGPCDIVFAQNFLFHLKRAVAREAIENIFRLLRPGSVLFADGVDLDLRQKAVLRRGLIPVDDEIEQIHNEARRARAVGWPYHYWGLEPFMTYRRDWRTRYATVFVAP